MVGKCLLLSNSLKIQYDFGGFDFVGIVVICQKKVLESLFSVDLLIFLSLFSPFPVKSLDQLPKSKTAICRAAPLAVTPVT